MIGAVIGFTLSHLGMVLLVLALVIAWIINRSHDDKAVRAETYYRWLSLLPAGICGIYAFIMHAFFGDFSAAVIGWSNSPFQFEVAVANFAIGLPAIIAFRKHTSFGFRAASTLGVACWLWGDGLGHIYQMITAHNFAPGNAGSWFWLDVILPALLIVSLRKSKK